VRRSAVASSLPRRCVAALLLLAACGRESPTPWAPAAADPRTVRRLPAGDVIGGAGRYGSFAWLGIPYAKPPVGDRRWRAPEPAERWGGTRRALAFGPACPQYGSRFGGAPGVGPGEIGGSEDCLTLNVWTPETAATGLPVFVWIHGGGNTIGHAGTYDGGNLAATHRLVVVTVQYRLGPLGWFRHPAVRAGTASAAEESGNFAVLDLVRALAWVRDNVAGFGGDPGSVTIAGESAGGQNVYALLLTPEARGLFHRAIVESGGLWSYSVAAAEHATDDPEPGDPQSSAEIVFRLLQRKGLAADRAAAKAYVAKTPAGELAAWLRAIPAAELLAAYAPTSAGMIDMPRALRDGAVLPDGDLAAHLARADGWNRVPVIAGTNLDENKLFMFADPEWVRMRFWILPRVVDEARYEVTSEYLARAWKARGADGPATAMATSQPRTFVYRFDWRDEPTILGADLGKLLGAAHAFEIPFVFGHFDLGPEVRRIYTEENAPGRQALSRAMMSYWAAFAYTGDPGRGRDGDLPRWEPWDGARFLVLDAPAGGGVRMGSGAETRDGVLAAVAADPRLASPRDRCRVLHELVEDGRLLGRAEYARRGCADFPYDAYPWDE